MTAYAKQKLLRCLRDGELWTTTRLGKSAKINAQQVHKYFVTLRAQGYEIVKIEGEKKGGAAFYKMITKEKPVVDVAVAWWPKADPVVIDAMRAMCLMRAFS